MKKKPKKVYKVILRNVDSFREIVLFKAHKYLFWLYFWTLILAIIGLSFYLFNSSFSRFVNPYHFYGVSKEKFNKLVSEVDALEKQSEQNSKYVSLLQKIIKEGNIGDLNNSEISKDFDPSYSLNKNDQPSPILTKVVFEKPIQGEIIGEYYMETLHKKITMKGANKSPVMAVSDGYVVCVTRSIPFGKIIILHDDGMTSIYHCRNITILDNQSVSSGQIIGNLGSLEANRDYNFVFELFCNGQSVNPKDFIDF